MTLPAPNLDDLRFQRDLVDEARKRIINYCPEWTEYNLSDPGITLIELFAWMTELMVYRLNRVPDKNYIKFLEMLGLQQKPANSAQTELTFWLSANLPLNPGDTQTVIVPEGFEVRSEMSDEDVVFTTVEPLVIYPPILTQVRKEGEFNKNHASRLGVDVFLPFDAKAPQDGNTFYLGFDAENNLSGHIVKLDFTCEATEAVGIRRDDPPWVWEFMDKDGVWHEVKPSTEDTEEDTTGGLNNEEGQLVFYFPLEAAPGEVYGLNAFWLRCRLEQRNALQGMYTESPRVMDIDVHSLGAAIPAMHSVNIDDEVLGVSNGEPGQVYSLLNSPVLTLSEGEMLEVEELVNGEEVFIPWEQVSEFSNSSRFDRHYVMNMATGEVHFGPSVRQPDGTVVQYGRIPENGRRIHFTRYRYGGGVTGNLPARRLTTMGMSLAYIARVSNLVRATGGRDQETLDELKLRAQRELQAQRRAVTAKDYEQFTLSATRAVERAKCLSANNSQTSAGTVSVLVVPSVGEALHAGNLAALYLNEKLRAQIRKYLDQYRLLSTALSIGEPRYTGVKIKTRIVAQDYVKLSDVKQMVNDELKRYLTPIPLDGKNPLLKPEGEWKGWEFGRDLFLAEVISLIQQVPSVRYVMDVEIYARPVVPVEEKSFFEDMPDAPLTKIDSVLPITEEGLLCSLEHEIEVLSVEEAYQKDDKK